MKVAGVRHAFAEGTRTAGQALAGRRACAAEGPTTVEVFELCINGQGIAPGDTGQNNPIEQRERLEHQTGGNQQKPDFLAAIEHGMPPAGGIGIDRLCMRLLGQEKPALITDKSFGCAGVMGSAPHTSPDPPGSAAGRIGKKEFRGEGILDRRGGGGPIFGRMPFRASGSNIQVGLNLLNVDGKATCFHPLRLASS